MPLHNIPKLTALVFVLAATTACGGDDPVDDASDDPGEAAAMADDVDGSNRATVVVDDVTYTFTLQRCVMNPDEPEQFSISGTGTDSDDGPAHITATGPNVLMVIAGADPIAGSGTRYEANPDDPEAPLDDLVADGSSVSARPEMMRTDGDRADPVGTAQFDATCG